MGHEMGAERRKVTSAFAELLLNMSDPEGEFALWAKSHPCTSGIEPNHRRETLGGVEPSTERQAPNRIAQLRLHRKYRAWHVPASSLDRHASGANLGV